MKYLKETLLDMMVTEWSKETEEYVKKLSYVLANDMYVNDLYKVMKMTKDFVWKVRSDYNGKLYPGVRVKFKSLTPDQLGSKLPENLKKDDGYYYGWIHEVIAFPGDPIHLYITVITDDKINVTTAIANQSDVEIVEELPEDLLNTLYEYSKLCHGNKNLSKYPPIIDETIDPCGGIINHTRLWL